MEMGWTELVFATALLLAGWLLAAWLWQACDRVKQPIGRDVLAVAAVFVAIFAVSTTAGGLVAVYEWADSAGRISHYEETWITAQTNWLVGESKDCTSYALDSRMAQAYGTKAGYAFLALACDDGPEHRVKVKFFGRREQPEYSFIEWKCTRGPRGFTCYQLSGWKP